MFNLEGFPTVDELISALPQPLQDHWYVAAIGLAFLCLQVFLCLRFLSRMKRHRRELRKLLRDLEAGGDGRDVREFFKDMPWLKWVDDNFPRDATTPGSYTREDVLKELDAQIAADGNYLLLQRTGVMAPLLGVIITVVGFMVLEMPDDENMSLGDIMYSVMPLVAGVGTGALLAFINQWLLHLAGRRVETVRYAARSWFDSAIWRSVGLDVQAATVKVISAMERMSRAIAHAAKRQKEHADSMNEGIRTIRHAADRFRETFDAFGQEVEEWPRAMRELAKAHQAAAASIDSLVPIGERAIGQLSESVTAFQTAVNEEFLKAAKTHRRATDMLAESIGRINESTMQLKLSSGDLQQTVSSHANSFNSLNRSLQKQVLPAHETFYATMAQFTGHAEGLVERMDALHAEVVASIEKLASLAPDATAVVESFSQSAQQFTASVQEQFAPAAERHAANAATLSQSVETLSGCTSQLGESNAAVGQLAKLHLDLVREAQSGQQRTGVAIQQLAEACRQLHDAVRDELTPGQQRLHASADTLHDASNEFAEAVTGKLVPVTQQLVQLDQTLQRLATPMQEIREFADIGGIVQRLSESLAQTANVADAISDLPDQVRQALEQFAETHQNQMAASSRRGWSLLRSR